MPLRRVAKWCCMCHSDEWLNSTACTTQTSGKVLRYVVSVEWKSGAACTPQMSGKVVLHVPLRRVEKWCCMYHSDAWQSGAACTTQMSGKVVLHVPLR